MKILVVSDIHANLSSLRAILDASGDCSDGFLCLGDITGYGCEPTECIALLRKVAGNVEGKSAFFPGFCRILGGNHDAVLTGKLDESWFNRGVLSSIEYTRERLGPEDLAWLAALLPAIEGPASGKEGSAFFAVHGSPVEPLTGYLWGGEETREAFAFLAERNIPLCFAGHTHVASVFSPDDTAFLTDGAVLTVGEKASVIVNPGSAGFPRSFGVFHSRGRFEIRSEPISMESYPAYYALWDTEAHTVSFREARYDRRSFAGRCVEAGLLQL